MSLFLITVSDIIVMRDRDGYNCYKIMFVDSLELFSSAKNLIRFFLFNCKGVYRNLVRKAAIKCIILIQTHLVELCRSK